MGMPWGTVIFLRADLQFAGTFQPNTEHVTSTALSSVSYCILFRFGFVVFFLIGGLDFFRRMEHNKLLGKGEEGGGGGVGWFGVGGGRAVEQHVYSSHFHSRHTRYIICPAPRFRRPPVAVPADRKQTNSTATTPSPVSSLFPCTKKRTLPPIAPTHRGPAISRRTPDNTRRS